jgi:hypothetical protein
MMQLILVLEYCVFIEPSLCGRRFAHIVDLHERHPAAACGERV